MIRAFFLAITIASASEAELQRALVNRQVTLRLDMPGTHEGVNLHIDRDQPLDQTQHEKFLADFGVAIPQGRRAAITALHIKSSVIEVHIDGGGFGTYGDDTRTTISTSIPKSNREVQLERLLRRETDPNRRRRLRSDLDREQRLRSREETRLRAASGPANAAKREQVMTDRQRGGSRFNLRGVSRANDVTAAQIIQWLGPYADFTAPAPPATPPPPRSPGAALREGMTLADVQNLLGQGKLLHEFTTTDGIRSQLWEFPHENRAYQVTIRNGVVTSYTRTAPR
ncbi:MAG TPA: hypothetical protein VFQ91_17930 [Bryobacteraceae bacterium]|nr:hypothetical protein [Bryobacteraceae bacterium]